VPRPAGVPAAPGHANLLSCRFVRPCKQSLVVNFPRYKWYFVMRQCKSAILQICVRPRKQSLVVDFPRYKWYFVVQQCKSAILQICENPHSLFRGNLSPLWILKPGRGLTRYILVPRPSGVPALPGHANLLSCRFVRPRNRCLVVIRPRYGY
jgi:hypothetical protein